MTDREAMKMALDAFEDLKKSVTKGGAVSENWDAYYEKEYYALEALRQALAQPEREWVGLTDDEIQVIAKRLMDDAAYCSLHFAVAIGAKLKEKNG